MSFYVGFNVRKAYNSWFPAKIIGVLVIMLQQRRTAVNSPFSYVIPFLLQKFVVLLFINSWFWAGFFFLMVVRMTWPLLTLFNDVLFHLCDLRKFNLVRGDSIVLVCITAVV